MCGSYGRGLDLIGDIDYVVVNDGSNDDLYEIVKIF
jgi:glycosyltransferase involved in cell wall biosynthesis